MIPFHILAWGLLVVSGAHALRLGVYPDENTARQVVALGGALVYGVASWMCLCLAPAGAWIAVIFPIIGLSTVLLTGNRPDTWQLVVGGLQVALAIQATLILTGVV